MVKLYNTYTYRRSLLIETLYARTLIHSVEGQVNRLFEGEGAECIKLKVEFKF